MDINDLRVVGVVLGSLAFIGICWWAFSPKRKKRFEEDAMLPFADEEKSVRSARHASGEDEEEPSAGEKEPSVGEQEPSAEQKKGQDKQ